MVKRKISESLGVFIEHFDAKFDLLIDGYAAFDKKIDDLRMEMDKRFNEAGERLRAIEGHLELHDNQFEIVFEEFHNICAEVTALKV